MILDKKLYFEKDNVLGLIFWQMMLYNNIWTFVMTMRLTHSQEAGFARVTGICLTVPLPRASRFL